MVKTNSNRKTRLDSKGVSEGFIGFGAFASSSDTDVSSSQQQTNSYVWNPVYTGNDSTLSLLFARIVQKRDAVTVTKALQELVGTLQSPSNIPKPVRANAILHWAWLYHTRLVYENASSIRAHALHVWDIALQEFPKITTGVLRQQPELCGMIYATAKADPSPEVQQAGVALLLQKKHNIVSWKKGLFEVYASRILSYGRANVMHEALFPKRSSSSTETDGKKQEQESDAQEERYVRTIGCCLEALLLWIQEESTAKSLEESPISATVVCEAVETKLWWKTLSSTKPTLRRKTYQLMSVVALKAPHLLPLNLGTVLPQSLSSEKEAANIIVLLETVLVVIAHQRKDQTITNTTFEQFLSALSKPLLKILKKACYGARVESWGPILLPLTVHFPQRTLQLQLLQAALDSHVLVLGESNLWYLYTSITETAAFLLLRAGTSPNSHDVVCLWLRVIQLALATAPSIRRGPTVSSQNAFYRNIVKQIVQFDFISCENEVASDCDFHSEANWFWNDGLTFMESQPIMLVCFVQEMKRQKKGTTQTRLVPKLRDRFWQELEPYQQSSQLVPSDASYQLLETIINYNTPLLVFDNSNNNDNDNAINSTKNTVENFVMNDILRWAVLHTSVLSEFEQNDSLVQKDFILLFHCLVALPMSRATILWDTFLEEIVKAKCDLKLLVTALKTMTQYAGEDTDWLQCGTLDDFVIQVVDGTIDDRMACSRKELDDEEESIDMVSTEDIVYDIKLSFFRTCVGVDSANSHPLIGNHVMIQMVDTVVDSFDDFASSQTSALFEVFLQKLKENHLALTTEQAERLVLKSWYRLETFFEIYSNDILRTNDALRIKFVDICSNKLKADVLSFSSTVATELAIETWTRRAYRLIQTCKYSNILLPGFGFNDISLWQQFPTLLFTLIMSLFNKINDEIERMTLVESWSQKDLVDTMLNILFSLSEATTDAVMAAKSKVFNDQCAMFLVSIGGKSLEKNMVEAWIRRLVSRLCAEVGTSQANENHICKQVAVLSQLLILLFDESLKIRGQDEDIDIDKVRDMERGCTVKSNDIKHFQIFQDKLRRDHPTLLSAMKGGNIAAYTSGDDCRIRSSLLNFVLNQVVLPHAALLNESTCLGEVIHICISQIGLGNQRGLGSPHYSIHRCICATEESVRAICKESGIVEATNGLMSLSLALGFGRSVPTSTWILSKVKINPMPLINVLVEVCYDGVDIETKLAVLAWLTVSTETAVKCGNDHDDTLTRALTLLFDLSRRMLDKNDFTDDFTGASLVACRALQVGIDAIVQYKMEHMGTNESMSLHLFKTKQTAFDALIQAFIRWEAENLEIDCSNSGGMLFGPNWYSLSEFPCIVASSMKEQDLRESLAISTSFCSEAIVKTLYMPSKRFVGLLLLVALADHGQVLQDSDNIDLSIDTCSHLKSWLSDLGEDEATEIEEAVYIVGEWLPVAMMAEVERWAIDGIVSDAHDIVIGHFLSWLVLLRFVDSAAPHNFRNRPAFISYLNICEAAVSILNLALFHNATINDEKRKTAPTLLDMETLMSHETLLEPSQLSSLVLFRTVEVLPSLSRRWWEEDCPNVYSSAALSFVQKYVSPEIFKREMNRIKSASAVFGPMDVSASMASREVSATYEQDDFLLRILVSLPPAFPFRSAEVDCSKTLGVPQSRWKRWSLLITLMLNKEGGTLQDALLLWKENVDKEFEGVEACPICYSVVHVKTHKLPELRCKTCSNCFHVDCLQQWFKSSGKSQCVLCQQPWQGSRV